MMPDVLALPTTVATMASMMMAPKIPRMSLTCMTTPYANGGTLIGFVLTLLDCGDTDEVAPGEPPPVPPLPPPMSGTPLGLLRTMETTNRTVNVNATSGQNCARN